MAAEKVTETREKVVKEKAMTIPMVKGLANQIYTQINKANKDYLESMKNKIETVVAEVADLDAQAALCYEAQNVLTSHNCLISLESASFTPKGKACRLFFEVDTILPVLRSTYYRTNQVVYEHSLWLRKVTEMGPVSIEQQEATIKDSLNRFLTSIEYAVKERIILPYKSANEEWLTTRLSFYTITITGLENLTNAMLNELQNPGFEEGKLAFRVGK
jgi:hypothetical protein